MDAERIAEAKKYMDVYRGFDKPTLLLDYIGELEQQLSYQTDRAESFCTRLHEEEHRNEELRQRCETMSAYLRTHDHRLHDAAMAAAKEH